MALKTVAVISCPKGDRHDGFNKKVVAKIKTMGKGKLSKAVANQGAIIITAKEDRLMMDLAKILSQSVKTDNIIIDGKSRIGLASRGFRFCMISDIVAGFVSKTEVLIMVCHPDLSLRLQSDLTAWLPAGVEVKFF